MSATEDQLKALMLNGLAGDADAHAALLRALVPLLRSFFSRRLHDLNEDTEDLVQEVLIAVHTRRATFDVKRPFTAWLFAIARYRLVDHLRRRRAIPVTENLDEILVAEGFENALSARMDLDTLLAGLTAKQARAIRDTHIAGYSIAEAAEAAGLGESDVKVSVHRGLKALAAKIRGVRR
ncbi:MAG TPA: sigma-70 family RNA polymerase sigma factor [Nevskia sp.]|jgi:RNA polymerase sigma-70 factor (ECF subfamily)|nr:sigma-70 family RNA polymerase sigma factor [Nevskia sp.]